MIRTILATGVALAFVGNAHAADLYIQQPPVTYPEIASSGFDWSGFYIGVHGGYGWGTVDYAGGVPNVVSDAQIFDINGGFGGLQAGYNAQMDSIVLGVEADVSLSGIGGRGADIDPASAAPSHAHFDINWMGTVRGRLGFAAESFLLYGTAGLALADVTGGITHATGAGDHRTLGATHVGFVVGAGAEAAVTDSLSLKVEYQYANFGSQHYNFGSAGPADLTADASLSTHSIRAGLNFHF